MPFLKSTRCKEYSLPISGIFQLPVDKLFPSQVFKNKSGIFFVKNYQSISFQDNAFILITRGSTLNYGHVCVHASQTQKSLNL